MLTSTNSGPVANDDVVNSTYGLTVSVDVLANDTHPDGLPITLSGGFHHVGRDGDHPERDHRLHPPARPPSDTQPVTYTIGYTIVDPNRRTASAKVLVTYSQPVVKEKAVTIAADDQAKVQVGKRVTIDVLANDVDPDGTSLSIKSIEPPTAGTASISGRTIVYDAPQGVPDGAGLIRSSTRSRTRTARRVGHRGGPDQPGPSQPVAKDDLVKLSANESVWFQPLANDSTLTARTRRCRSPRSRRRRPTSPRRSPATRSGSLRAARPGTTRSGTRSRTGPAARPTPRSAWS
ncbi:MAG: Ig-like domain-containing protein [Ilumatobacteraceae bacterium]